MKRMKMMMVAALMLTAFAGFAACSYGNCGSMGGNLNYLEQDLQPKAFKAIDVDVVADVYYTQNDGDKHDVRLDFSAIKDKDLAERMKESVKVVYRDGGVEIGLSKRISGTSDMGSGKRLKVYITSPDLVKVGLEGVGSFRADKVNSDRLDIDNEGVGSVYIKQLLANKVSVDNEGVGSVELGNVTGDVLDIDNEGVGSVKVAFYKGGSLKIDNEGVGHVSAKVDCHSVRASLDGVGSVTLSGVTKDYHKEKDGVGSFNDKGLKVLK